MGTAQSLGTVHDHQDFRQRWRQQRRHSYDGQNTMNTVILGSHRHDDDHDDDNNDTSHRRHSISMQHRPGRSAAPSLVVANNTRHHRHHRHRHDRRRLRRHHHHHQQQQQRRPNVVCCTPAYEPFVQDLQHFRLRQIPTDDDTCLICTEEFELGCVTTTLPCSCNRMFHSLCIVKWLESHSTCPICRHQLPIDYKDYEKLFAMEQDRFVLSRVNTDDDHHLHEQLDPSMFLVISNDSHQLLDCGRDNQDSDSIIPQPTTTTTTTPVETFVIRRTYETAYGCYCRLQYEQAYHARMQQIANMNH